MNSRSLLAGYARSASLVLLAAFASPFAFAQGTPPALVAGGAGAPNFLQQQVWCAAPTGLCRLPTPPPTTAWAGGTAYDTRQQTIWDTEGLFLTGMRSLAAAPCAPICGPMPIPGLPAGAVACGLAYDEARATLIMIDSSPAIAALPIALGTRCPAAGMRCPLLGVFPAPMQPGGLAYSEKHDTIFYSVSNFGPGLPGTIVFAARWPAAPCAPICKFAVPVCPTTVPFGAVTGLAYDDGTNELYLTDGTQTMRLTVVPGAAGCLLGGFKCCPVLSLGPLYGLDIEPSHAITVGLSCLGAPCVACPGMALAAVGGDPTIGNPAFALALSGAPPGVATAACINFPGCGAGLPIGCGLFYPSVPGLLVLPALVTAGGACAATANQPLPIPVNYAFCGVPLCLQMVLVCPGPGLGLSNALNITISDN